MLTNAVQRINWTRVIVIVLAAGYALSQWQGRRDDQQHTAQLITALGAQMQQRTDKLGDRVSYIPAAQTSPKIYLQATAANQDPEIIRLRQEIEALKGQAASSSIGVASSTETVEARLDAGGRAGDEWFSAQVTPDSLHYTSRHEFTAAFIGKTGGLTEFVFKDKNPHNKTTSVRAFAPVPVEVKRWGIGPYAGYDAARGISAGVAASYHLFAW